MPIYEFRCPTCGAEFSELMLRHDPDALADVKCPKCGQSPVVRRISSFAATVKAALSRASAAACAPSG